MEKTVKNHVNNDLFYHIFTFTYKRYYHQNSYREKQLQRHTNQLERDAKWQQKEGKTTADKKYIQKDQNNYKVTQNYHKKMLNYFKETQNNTINRFRKYKVFESLHDRRLW